MGTIGTAQQKGLILKTTTVWLSICLLVGFIATARSVASPISLTTIPDVPKTGEPIVATFNISNPENEESTTEYWLYVNGQLVESGCAVIAPHQSIKHQYAHQNYLERGEQVTFVLRTASKQGETEKVVSIPAYPPQVMSSFVSFAAFSTSVMSSLVSMEYFTSTFGTGSGPNAGLIICAVLIGLLIFLELTQVITTGRGTTILGSYRTSFKVLSTILFIILIGMVFTRVVLIVAT
ncbi:MAG: hypothetical protein PHU08_05325 [Dehalococcoidales bacterium]|nr:hypothetical protein [Dehalococcoidales bacterium]